MAERVLDRQNEEIPRPRTTKKIGTNIIAHEAGGGTPGRAEVVSPPVGQALALFYDHCGQDRQYPKVSRNVQAKLRPGLALDFVRDVVTRTGERKGDPAIRPTFDEEEVRRNIAQIQDNYGTVPYPDYARNKARVFRITSQMQRVAPYSEFSMSGLPVNHEVNAAYMLYAQALDAADIATQDSMEVLLAAYGMSLKSPIEPIE